MTNAPAKTRSPRSVFGLMTLPQCLSHYIQEERGWESHDAMPWTPGRPVVSVARGDDAGHEQLSVAGSLGNTTPPKTFIECFGDAGLLEGMVRVELDEPASLGNCKVRDQGKKLLHD